MNISHELAKMQSDMCSSTVRSLSRAEIEALASKGEITPLPQIRERSMGPRVSFPDRLNGTTFGLRLMSRKIGQGCL